MNCESPCAPALETAAALKPDSCLIWAIITLLGMSGYSRWALLTSGTTARSSGERPATEGRDLATTLLAFRSFWRAALRSCGVPLRSRAWEESTGLKYGGGPFLGWSLAPTTVLAVAFATARPLPATGVNSGAEAFV